MNKRTMQETLRRLVEEDHISHAYILEGLETAWLEETAYRLIQAVLCRGNGEKPCGVCSSCRKIEQGEHEDLFFAEPSGASLKDEDIEAVQRRLAKKPYSGGRNAALIRSAETMTLRAQNRLLKTLEEPPGQALIVLLTKNAEQLLPTIRSRCIVYSLERETRSREEAALPARTLAETVGGMLLDRAPFYAVAERLSEIVQDREAAQFFLEELELWYRDLMLFAYTPELVRNRSEAACDRLRQSGTKIRKEDCSRMVRLIEEAWQDLEHNGNVGYALKGMILSAMGE